MSSSAYGILFLGTLGLWIVGGLLWLFPRKLRLLRRLGSSSDYYRIRDLAKNGDRECQLLLRDSKRYMFLGLGMLLPIQLLKTACFACG